MKHTDSHEPSARPETAESGILEDHLRLETLEATALLDTPPEETFDRYTRLAASILGVPVSLLSLVAHDRQFFKSCFGLAEPYASDRQTPLSHSFCQFTVVDREPLVVEDARDDPRLCRNGAVRDLNVVAYLGVPLMTSNGAVLGSLCAIHFVPRRWQPRELSLLQDLAASVVRELELRLLARQLQQAQLEARHRELQREELTMMLVHDLRNPLTSILSGLELARLEGEEAQAQRHLDLASEAAGTVLEMIDSLLDLNSAEAGRMKMASTWFQVPDLLEEARRHLASLAEAHGVILTAKPVGKIPPLEADRAHLRRTLINLAANAIQHTPRGGRVELRASRRGDAAILLEVEDTGSGIPEEAFGLIFEKYGQVETRKFRPATSGLGLPLSKMVIAAHGGSIEVESTLGQGTLFRVELPVE